MANAPTPARQICPVMTRLLYVYYLLDALDVLMPFLAITQAKRVKTEPPSSPTNTGSRSTKLNHATYTSADSDDDTPLAAKQTKVAMPGAYKAATGATAKQPRRSTIKSYKEDSDDEMEDVQSSKASVKKEEDTYESSDDDIPLSKKKKTKSAAVNGNGKPKAPSRRASKKKQDSDTEMSDAESEEKPKRKRSAPSKRVKKESVKDEEDSDDEPLQAKTKPRKSKVKKEENASPKKAKKEEEENVYKWWAEEAPDDVEGDGTKKWDTLQHNGVFFPPAYEPLPEHVKLVYNGTYATHQETCPSYTPLQVFPLIFRLKLRRLLDSMLAC